jgi:DNA-binding NtrC family response regulator
VVNPDDNMNPIANILVIDDEPDIAEVIRIGLQLRGFKSSSFTDPSEALEHFRGSSNEYCAVVSDIRMPKVTGFQMAREIKKINPKVKVILMSSFEITKEEFSKLLPSMAVDDFVTKPVGIERVKDVLLKHIGQTKELVPSTPDK